MNYSINASASHQLIECELVETANAMNCQDINSSDMPKASSNLHEITISSTLTNFDLVASYISQAVFAASLPEDLKISSDGTHLSGKSVSGALVKVEDVNGEVIGLSLADSNGDFMVAFVHKQDNGQQLDLIFEDSYDYESPRIRLTAPDITAPSVATDLVVINNGTQITGRGEKGSTVSILDANGNLLGLTIIRPDGSFAATLITKQTNGQKLNIVLTDNSSNASLPIQIRAPDIEAPNAARNLSVIDNGTQVMGHGEVGATAMVRNTEGKLIGIGTVSEGGIFTVQLTAAQTNGQSLSVTLKDPNGNESLAAQVISIDSTAPLRATNLRVLNYGTQITGQGEDGATVIVKDALNNFLGLAVTDAKGDFTVTLLSAQTQGETLSVILIDKAGNRSAAVALLVAPQDDLAPDAPLAVVVNASGTEVTGTGEVGATVLVKNASGQELGTAVVDAAGFFVVNLSVAQTNGQKLSVTLKDAAGNVGPAGEGTSPIILLLRDVGASVAGFYINGQSSGDQSSLSVSNAGDVNCDGFDDLIIGAPYSDPVSRTDAGRTYVVFGKGNMNSSVNLSAIAQGIGGFVINGQSLNDRSGWSVSSARDVNGDGFADLIVGAPKGSPSTGVNAGRSYVVFGKANGSAVNLSAVAAGSGGFVINGQASGDESGVRVSSAGDVNGDGLGDLIVSSSSSSPGLKNMAGRSYVVFGKTDTSAINLSAVAAGSGGFVINGASAGDESGYSVSCAGDVNGDGLADLIVGAIQSSKGTSYQAGASYVVFGKKNTSSIDLSSIDSGTGGFAIRGISNGDLTGFSVSNGGDINGDGLADLIVTAPATGQFGSGSNLARAYVVFGKTNTSVLNLSAVLAGSGGFVVNCGNPSDFGGLVTSSAGDINGDGLNDFILGAPSNGDALQGASYVIFGRSRTSEIDLGKLGTNGFAIKGNGEYDFSGSSVSGAGDINGDGLADLIVSAPGASQQSGCSYVIFGSTTGKFSTTTRVDQMGTAGNDVLNDGGTSQTLIGGQGNDTMTATAASVMYGGRGNDTFIIGQAMVSALQSPFGQGGNINKLARIDGGNADMDAAYAYDTIEISGKNLVFDLTKISNQSGGGPDGGSRIESIERIQLTDATQTILLTAADVLSMGSRGAFAPNNNRVQLMISTGSSSGTLDLVDTGWIMSSGLRFENENYQVWTHSKTSVMLYVEDKITVI